MVDVESKLKELFKTYSKKPFLFIGAGLSRRYYGLPNWERLLKHLANHTSNTKYAYEKYHQEALSNIEPELRNRDFIVFPMIASLIERDYNKRFFSEDDFDTDIKIHYENEIHNKISPFKLYISDYLRRNCNETETFANEKEQLLMIKNRISGIITTNYDLLIENIFNNEMTVFTSELELFNNPSKGFADLYKIHGCVTKPESIVLTHEDYKKVINNTPFVSAKLLTFFIEKPIIFIGYSINDENIMNILETISSKLTDQNKQDLKNRLVFIEYTDNIEKENIITTEKCGLLITKVILYDYNKLYKAINIVPDGIDIKLLKLIQDKIVCLIENNNPNIDKVYAASLFSENLNENSVAILIGNNDSVFRYGYAALRFDNIMEDVLFENKNYDPAGIFENTILENKHRFNCKLPLYKYKKQYTKSINSWITSKLIDKIDDLYNPTEKRDFKTKYKNRENSFSIDEIVKKNLPLPFEIDMVYKNLQSASIDELELYLKNIWNRRNTLKSKTKFKKLVVAYDFLKNK